MYLRLTLALLALLATSAAGLAQQVEPYDVPRTAHGHPDFQGVWATEFLTMLERPPGVDNLVASPEHAQRLAATIWSQLPDVLDPQVRLDDTRQLAMVQGEYRTSVIVEPENGHLPFTQTGLNLAAWSLDRDTQLFDRPDQRPLVERCLESFGYPPMRTIPIFLPRQLFQTRDHVVIVTEDQVGLRIIRLEGEPPPDRLRSFGGYSTGHWEGDTLVVRTTHLRDEDPARFVLGRPLLLGRDSTITERFTRVSETELFYQFTVEDDELYTEPWKGEFSMVWHDGPMYEYACHEGNYSMPTILIGGRAEAARLAETERDRD